jgi:hypothetical protein
MFNAIFFNPTSFLTFFIAISSVQAQRNKGLADKSPAEIQAEKYQDSMSKITQDNLIEGYMFICVYCGNKLPVRYTGAGSGPYRLNCRACTEKVATCHWCDKDMAKTDLSPTKNKCMDCWSEATHDVTCVKGEDDE